MGVVEEAKRAAGEGGTRRRVCVIGAGAAGLVVARSFRDAGFEVEVWELANEVGGTWLYSELVAECRGNIYRSLVTNLPKEIMQFVDLPFGESGLPSFVKHSDVARYLQQYAEAFDLRPLIRFNTEITLVEPLPPSPSSGGLWRVFYRRHCDDGDEEEKEEGGGQCVHYHIVMVCSGHHSKPFVPAIDGLDSFPNAILHSREYREPTPFIGKSVVLVGAGASGVDITREVGSVAREVYAVVRSKPPLATHAGTSQKTAMADMFGHAPAEGVVLKMGCEIRQATSDGYVEFSDGTRTRSPVDAIIFCTGYRYDFPFLSPSCRVFLHPDQARRALRLGDETEEEMEAAEEQGMSVWPLYEHVIHVEHPSLAFIGLNWKVLPFACFETQTRFVLALMRHPNFLAWDASDDLNSCLLDPSSSNGHLDENDEKKVRRWPSTKRAMMDDMWGRWRACVTANRAEGAKRRCLREYHLLGSQQWSYYAHLQRLTLHIEACAQAHRQQPGRTDDSEVEFGQGRWEDLAANRDWTRVREIYDDVAQARLRSPDTYRLREYSLSPSDDKEWSVNHETTPESACNGGTQ